MHDRAADFDRLPQRALGVVPPSVPARDVIRSQQERRRDGQAEGPGGLEVDHQLELRRLLDRQVDRLGALEDLVDASGAPSCRAKRAC
jgi:hypothetical protein